MTREKIGVTARQETSQASEPPEVPAKRNDSIVDRGLQLLSSVRFGIVMIVLVLACCVVGMLIMQQNVAGFSQYYQRLNPAQRELYGILGLFDIYHSSFFTVLLAITALNIILSSIDRFPVAWRYIRKPRSLASPNFVRAQMLNTSTETNSTPEKAAEKIASVWKELGFRPRLGKGQQGITVFAQRNAWNRLGAYFVHVALLTIFVGGLLTSRYGVGGTMEIKPGETSDSFMTFDTGPEGGGAAQARMPFEVECTDLQQQLLKPEGGLDVMNTIDWLSYVKIKDGSTEVPALIHLNSPFDHRGYRFFQSSFQPTGSARQITITIASPGEKSRDVTIQRNGVAEIVDLGRVSYVNFYPDFTTEHGHPANASDDYNNPVAELRITAADGSVRAAFARIGSSEPQESGATADPVISLKGFEKVATSHTLSIQYDPGRIPVYVGFALLTLSLTGVFFFSHQRMWAVIEANGKRSRVHFGGHTNRNKSAFELRFKSLVQASIGGRG